MICVDLPWPSRDLHPNARVHWAKKARATKKARTDAGWAAKEAGVKRMNASALSVTVTFYPPNRRAHDLDGCMASCKAFFDGIADVIGVDDSKWLFGPPRKEEPVKNGAVRVQIEDASHIAKAAIQHRNERRFAHIDEVVARAAGQSE